jgi:uncharacterized protein (TIRG00374 family)
MGSPSPRQSRPPRNGAPRWGAWVVYGVSIGCLLWVYSDFNWSEELPRLARIHWGWIALAVACDVLVYVSQAWRWNLLLKPVAELPFWRSVQAIYIGLFANELLPLRSGELIRCYLLSAWNRVRFPLVLSSALIERLVDGVWLILGFYAVSRFMDLPRPLEAGAAALGAIVAGAGALVLFAVLNKRFAHHVVTRHRWAEVLRTAVEGLHAMGRSRSFVQAVGASLVYLSLQVIPIHAILEGYGLDLPWGSAVVVLIVLRLGTVVPGPPGNLGVFHFFCYLALNKVLGIEEQTAKSLTGMMFFIITVPLLTAGFIAIASTGLKVREILHRARQHHERPAPEEPRAGQVR